MAKTGTIAGAQPSDRLLQLRIELADLKPAIWRRVVMPDTISLVKLHQVIQASMGWTDSHLHEFDIAGRRYGVPDPDWDTDGSVISEKRIALSSALGGSKSFRYTYDFGDNWEHRIKVEKALPLHACPRAPLCLDGANACPPDDVGGPPGYIDFLEAISDPHHPEHEDMLDWCGGGFDPVAFDLDHVNKQFQRIKS